MSVTDAAGSIRKLNIETSEALSDAVAMILPIVELEIIELGGADAPEPVRAWGGIGELNWDGKTWLGVGNMGEIGPIQADAKGSIPSLDLSLLGIEPEMLAIANQQLYRGKNGKVWLACFDDQMKMIGDATLYFAGEISSMSLSDGTERRIGVSLDSRMAVLKKNKPRYRTDEDQQRQVNGDAFFNFVSSAANKTVYWGLNAPSGTGRKVAGGGVGNSEYLDIALLEQ